MPGAAVAVAEGATIDPEAVSRELEEAHAELLSSMARDVMAGRPPELDAIGGAVLRAGARNGIDTPTVRRLVDKIRSELESGELKMLPLRDMRQITQSLYLVFADREGAGPGTLRLAEILKEQVPKACAAACAGEIEP